MEVIAGVVLAIHLVFATCIYWFVYRRRPSNKASVVSINPEGPILVENEENVTLKAHFTNNSYGQFVATWQKVENGVARNLSLDKSNYNGSSCDLANLKLVINDTDHTDTGNYQIEIRSLTETITSQQVTVKVYQGSLSYISNEETNFFRLYLLCHQIGTRAVRLLFDRYVTPTNLHSHLQKYRKNLEDGNRKLNLQRCTFDQLKTLFRAKPGVDITSDDFDLTLLYKVIRCTVTQISSHASRWNHAPLPQHIGESDDLERIHQCRNSIAHDNTLLKTDDEFKVMWNDLYGAIDRLSKGSLKGEMDDLKTKIFHGEDTKKILDSIEEVKEDLKHQYDVIKQIENRVAIIEEEHIPKNIRESQQLLMTSWKDEDRIFYSKTSICKAGWEMVKSQKITTFIGSPGSGKTATSRHIALRFEREEEYEIVPVSEPGKILEYVNINRKQVFDDILGKFCLDMSLYNIIERHKEDLRNGLGKNSKIIFTSRKTVYKEAEKLHTFITENCIDFQARENLLSENDKRQILQYHCRENNISEEDFQEISLRSADIMFPLLCKLFSTDIKYREVGETFFNQPIECLLQEIDRLKAASPVNYTAVILCLVNDGEISWDTLPSKEIETDVYNRCGIYHDTSDGAIMKAIEEMTDTYLRRMNKVYTFIHDSIFEVAAFHYGRELPDQILKYMSSSFITNRVKVCQQPSTVGDFSIVLSSSQYSMFAERLYQDIEALELYDVFMNPALKHPAFLREFLKMLSSKPFNDVFDLFCSQKGNLKHINEDSEKFFEEKTGVWNEYERQQILLNATHYEHDEDNGLHCIFFNNKFLDIRSDTRIISWVVYYGHTEILENIFNNASKNNKSITSLVGEDILEQSRLLSLACFSNSYDMVNLLLKHIKHESINSCFSDTPEEEIQESNGHKLCLPTSAACQMGDINIVKLLLKNNGNFCLKIDGLTHHVTYVPLISAVRQGHFEVVQYIVTEQKERLSSEIKDVSLNVAVANGHYDITHLFVELGANLNFCKLVNGHPLNLACGNGHEKIVHYLMSLGADKNYCDEDGKSPVLFASECGHIEIVQFLIEKEADINHSDNSGNSPLLLASSHGYLEIAELLVGNGGNINHCDKNGNSPLIKASYMGYLDIVKMLVENGGNVNHKNKRGNSPLFVTSCDIVKYLLEKGACVNEQNKKLITPLAKAVENKHLELCKILLGCGAVIKHDEETILCYATMSGIDELVDLILTNIDLSKDCLVDALSIAFWEGHSYILQRLLSEGNKKGSFLGNLLLFDLITGIQKGTLPCECNQLNIPLSNRVLPMLKYSGALSRYSSITSFIMECSEKSFSRLLKIGLNPNSIVTHDNTNCPNIGMHLIQIMLDDVHADIVDRKEKVVRLLQNKVDLNCKCKKLRSIKYLIRGKVHYISVIEFARLQSCYEYDPYSFYPEMYYPMPFYFEMGIDDRHVLSEVVKDFRRKSV